MIFHANTVASQAVHRGALVAGEPPRTFLFLLDNCLFEQAVLRGPGGSVAPGPSL
jgi:hypothetical protein